MRRAMPRSQMQCGFTLIEVVVALTLLALMMAATVSALRTLGQTRDSVQAVTERVDEMRLVSRFLRNALMAAVPASNLGGLTLGGAIEQEGIFEGTAQSLIWKAPLMFGQDAGGSYELRLALEDKQLMLYWRNSAVQGKPDNPWTATNSRVLLKAVDAFALQYRPNGDKPWQSAWNADSSPRAVSMQLQVRDRFWPQIVVDITQ